MINDPQVVWETDHALCLAYLHHTCYAIHIIPDYFPFDDILVAIEMLSPIAMVNVDEENETEVVFVTNVMKPEELLELTEQVFCVIVELAKHQDEWLLMSPIERLELYGEIVSGNLE